VHTTQHFLAVSKDIFESPCAIFNNLLTWKQFLNFSTTYLRESSFSTRELDYDMQASGYLKRRAVLQHNYWKKMAKKTLPLSDCWCTLQVHCIVIFVAMKVCYYQLLDFRQWVRENLMKGQGVRVYIKVKNCFKVYLPLPVAPDGVLTYGKSKFSCKCRGKAMPSGFTHFYCHQVVLLTQKKF